MLKSKQKSEEERIEEKEKLFTTICICSWDYNLLIVGRSLFAGSDFLFKCEKTMTEIILEILAIIVLFVLIVAFLALVIFSVPFIFIYDLVMRSFFLWANFFSTKLPS